VHRFFALLLIVLLGTAWPALAQSPEPGSPAALNALNRTLDSLQATVRQTGDSAPPFHDWRATLAQTRTQAGAQLERIAIIRSERLSLLEALGSAPAEGQPAEAPALAKQRADLTASFQEAEGRVKQIEVVLTRIDALDDEIIAMERRRLTAELLQRGPSLLEPALWRDGMVQARTFADAAVDAPALWWERATSGAGREALITTGILLAVLLILLGPVRIHLLHRFGQRADQTNPAPVKVLGAAMAEGVAGSLLPAGAMLAIIAVLRLDGLADGLFGALLVALLFAAITWIVLAGLSDAALSPERPQWRLVPLTDESARKVQRRVHVLALALSLGSILTVLGTGVWGTYLELTTLRVSLMSIAFAIVLLSFAQSSVWTLTPGGAADLPFPVAYAGVAQKLVWIMLTPALAALVIGYDDLARLAIRGVLLSFLLTGIWLLVRKALRGSLDYALASSRLSGWRTRLEASNSYTMAQFWFGGLIETGLFVAWLLAMSQVWGVPTDTLARWARHLVEGVKVGGVTIALGDIVMAVILFLVAMTVVRATQTALRDRILPQTRLDPGVRNSVTAGLGYAGFVVAALLAVSALGLDLSNIALIAGALSVGIGFGLQNIVNNFVSGIILLVERPVKEGDWVVVGSHEGYVRRISVRATEIETFPRASVIVPNSELLSGAVMNWTHRDRTGRLDVNVGIDYSADPEQVRDILLDCVRKLDGVLAYPAPFVIFRDFGDSALVFTVRGYIANVEYRMSKESDLRFAIFKAMREHKIAIPYNQMEVSLRDVDRLEAVLREATAIRNSNQVP
jgi:potassium efflux system protein